MEMGTSKGDADVLARKAEAVRYKVNDLPRMGIGAFCPVPTTVPLASSWGEVELSGAPGTEPQPAPAPTRVWAPPISADKATQGSNVAPDVWLHDVYIPYPDNMGPSSWFGMWLRRLCPMPLPAIDPKRVPQPAMNAARRKIAGRDQVEQPRAFQRFPNWSVVRSFSRAY